MNPGGKHRPGDAPAPRRGDDALFARTLSAFKWAFLTSASQSLLSLLIVMVLARLLTPEHFGQLALALVFITLADALARRGLGPALIQRFELTGHHVVAAFTLSLGAGAALAAVLWFLAPWLGELSRDPVAAPVIRALSLVTVLSGAALVSEYRLRRKLRFRALMKASLMSQALGNGGVAIALALAGHGVWALVWGAVARQALFSLSVCVFSPPPRALGALGREMPELLRTGAGFSAIALLNTLAEQTMRLLIGRTLGGAALGLYTRANALAVLPRRLSPVLSNVLLPAMARRQRRIDRLRIVHLNGTELLCLIAVPGSLAIAASSPEIVAVVLGAQWSGAVDALRILALVGVLATFNALHAPLARALGAVYRESWRRAVYLLALLGGAWYASRWGLVGVVGAVAAARVLRYGLLAQLALGLLGLRWTRLLARCAPGIWVGAWATLAVALAAWIARTAAWSAPAALALQLAAWILSVAVAAYFAPPFARPAFPHWGLDRLPFDAMGIAGRRARGVLEHLARRWPRQAETPA